MSLAKLYLLWNDWHDYTTVDIMTYDGHVVKFKNFADIPTRLTDIFVQKFGIDEKREVVTILCDITYEHMLYVLQNFI